MLDTTGLKCPRPMLRLMAIAPTVVKGTILEVLGDCPTFESDIRGWCGQMGKVVLMVRNEEGEKKRMQIQF